MIDAAALLADLKRRVRLLEDDLRARAEEQDDAWAQELRAEYDRAFARERTALSWSEWRDGEVTLAAVAWIVACVFVRFAEDNGLLAGARDERGIEGPWLSGPGVARDRAVENQTAFHNAVPTSNSRDWFHLAFGILADLPAGKALLDRRHNPVWSAPISGAAADDLLAFWRQANQSGEVVHDFTDANLDTRFLGDLYQDLSEYAKKTYALLQTPVFVEEFILDRTLTPAIDEFGLEGLKLIDPTCGSGHFLLGAFARLDDAWQAHAPGLDARARVQKALDSIHGVDLNPFAVAIARFRLTVAALRASGEPTLTNAPAFGFHLAVGDSLLRSEASTQKLSIGDDEEEFTFSVEDVAEYAGILDRGQYHVVVGNPPYIRVQDAGLRRLYKSKFAYCVGRWVLSVPFMELFFELARRSDAAGGGAGYVGKITADSFMRREFGKELVEKFLSGADPGSPVDLTQIVDTSEAHIPGHGTPTVILVGRRRRPTSDVVRTVVALRAAQGVPVDPARGEVWLDVSTHVDEPGYVGPYASVTDVRRADLQTHPWSLAGEGAKELKAKIDAWGERRVGAVAARVGVFGATHADDVFISTKDFAKRQRAASEFPTLVTGESVRDYQFRSGDVVFFPYDNRHRLKNFDELKAPRQALWPYRSELSNRASFSGATYSAEGRPWYEWHQLPRDEMAHQWTIAYAEVATHNHFILERGDRVFAQTAPIVKLPVDASEDDHFRLLVVLNSSAACFWLKEVCQRKGGDPDQPWARTYQFNSTNISKLPLGSPSNPRRAVELDLLASAIEEESPARVVADWMEKQPETGIGALLESSRAHVAQMRRQMIFHQEELDWELYRDLGLVDDSVLYFGPVVEIDSEERPFAVALARRISDRDDPSTWFTERTHQFRMLSNLPTDWPVDYSEVVERRLDLITRDALVRTIEDAKYKRRWARRFWSDELGRALRGELLDRLEYGDLWIDSNGRPGARSIADLAGELRRDSRAREVAELLVGSSDVDYVALVVELMAGESVPHVAVQRYKAAGPEKFRAWQHVWELQRAEDRGEKVTIPVPPKYTQADFQKPSYWKARGKLDVPKERFISYPGATLPNDDSAVFGWAGWDHAERGQALLGLASSMSAEGASSDALMPLFAGLVELEPWLRQWHADVDPAFGMSPADAITGVFDGLLAQYGVSRDDVNAWSPTPTAARRGRRPATTGKANA